MSIITMIIEGEKVAQDGLAISSDGRLPRTYHHHYIITSLHKNDKENNKHNKDDQGGDKDDESLINKMGHQCHR